MAKMYEELDEPLQRFIAEQRIFFVASAPSVGRINLSPKGMDTFRCLSPKLVGYLDLTGSGAETAAHVLDDGRLTVLFCSFDEKPLILRLYGRGEIIRPLAANWQEYESHFTMIPGTRQIILMHIESAQTSCGFGVPLFPSATERPTLRDFAVNKGDDWLADYRAKKNALSIDGLPTGVNDSEP